jgi:hypothetical protein
MLFVAAAALALPLTVVAGTVHFVRARQLAASSLLVSAGPLTKAERSDGAPPVASDETATSLPGVRIDENEPRAAAPAAPVKRTGPEEMLRKANDLRAKHHWLDATQLYEQTMRAFPDRAEAYSASVAAALLRLDHLGDPRGALRLFSSAVRARPEGALSEEARWGRIESYRALGDRSSETTSLREFVSLYPNSLLAPRARARLRDHGVDTP